LFTAEIAEAAEKIIKRQEAKQASPEKLKPIKNIGAATGYSP
jgi:hypothetical protein